VGGRCPQYRNCQKRHEKGHHTYLVTWLRPTDRDTPASSSRSSDVTHEMKDAPRP
jgi:hypothetical protein